MGDMPTPFLFNKSCITAHRIAAKINGSITSRGPTNRSQLESELIIRAAFNVNLKFT